ncbi:hypothetical protein D3C80_1915820 [compost metagenome]
MGARMPSKAPSNRLPGLTDTFRTSHSSNNDNDSRGAGNRRLMVAPVYGWPGWSGRGSAEYRIPR